MNVLIVESPSKAKSINKYLGSEFKVLASIGHVRYPTEGAKTTKEIQPFYIKLPFGISLCHNGNIYNHKERKENSFLGQPKPIIWGYKLQLLEFLQ